MIENRNDAIKQFQSSPVHRTVSVQMLTVVIAMLLSCFVLKNTLPKAHLNNLIPLTIAAGLFLMFYFGKKYQRVVSQMIESAGLLCERCGQSSIPRPDHISFSSASQSPQSKCVSCGHPK